MIFNYSQPKNISDEAISTPPSTTVPTVPPYKNIQLSDPPEDSHEDDRQALGSQYNTRYYISPNATKNNQKVIKVVDEDDDDDDDEEDGGGVVLVGRPVGIAVYVLIAFGVVPLLLAFVFGTKFVINRRQRQV